MTLMIMTLNIHGGCMKNHPTMVERLIEQSLLSMGDLKPRIVVLTDAYEKNPIPLAMLK